MSAQADALQLWRLGWSVVPATRPLPDGRCSCQSPDCAAPGKHPAIKWTQYQRTRPTESDVAKWFIGASNVSVVTGRVSGLVVVDVDPDHGGDDSLHERLPELVTIDTPRAITGSGGQHIYLRHPGVEVPSRAGILPGIDIRADGGQVIAPPSVHASGLRYSWEVAPWEVPLAPIPERLMSMLVERTICADVDGRKTLEELLDEVAPEGRRHTHLTRIIGHLIATYRDSPWDLPVLAREANLRVCQPPLDEAEVESILDSLWRADRRRHEAIELPESEPTDDKAQTLSAIWQSLGLRSRVVGMRVYASVNESTWSLVLEGGKPVSIGTDPYNYAAVRRLLASELLESLKPVSAKVWSQAVERMLQCVDRVESMPPGAAQITEWAREFVDANRDEVIDADEVGDEAGLSAIKEGCPVIRTVNNTRYCWISIGQLHAWLSTRYHLRSSMQQLATWATQAGWERATFHAGSNARKLWRFPWHE